MILSLENVRYSYKTKNQTVNAIKGVSYSFELGRTYAITGRSGSGKTTLMSLIAGLDLPDQGKILYNGKSLSDINRNKYRREEISIVYQSFHLFSLLTALENVSYPMELNGVPLNKAKEKAALLLEEVGLTSRHFSQIPSRLSGGEQQRVAIARALSVLPKILLADEPTGNLDNESSSNIISLITGMKRKSDCCVIIITHDPDIAAGCDEAIILSDGLIV